MLNLSFPPLVGFGLSILMAFSVWRVILQTSRANKPSATGLHVSAGVIIASLAGGLLYCLFDGFLGLLGACLACLALPAAATAFATIIVLMDRARP